MAPPHLPVTLRDMAFPAHPTNAAHGARRVALACQGGGSHSAFVAGALQELLTAPGFDYVALSGTSGGAICAALAWHGLAQGDPAGASRSLGAFWGDVQARAPWDVALNAALVTRYRLDGVVALPAVSPQLLPAWGTRRLRRLIERHLPAERLPATRRPLLQVGAVDVLSGAFRTFSSARGEISIEALLASAAVPTLYPAVELDGRLYWDGLFSQNPPVRDLPDAGPSELWVLQINPPRRRRQPIQLPAILDRRDELAGNLSLNQELFFIAKINQLLAQGAFEGPDYQGRAYRHIEVRTILLDRNLRLPSKVDRSPALIEALLEEGRKQARTFLATVTSSER